MWLFYAFMVEDKTHLLRTVTNVNLLGQTLILPNAILEVESPLFVYYFVVFVKRIYFNG